MPYTGKVWNHQLTILDLWWGHYPRVWPFQTQSSWGYDLPRCFLLRYQLQISREFFSSKQERRSGVKVSCLKYKRFNILEQSSSNNSNTSHQCFLDVFVRIEIEIHLLLHVCFTFFVGKQHFDLFREMLIFPSFEAKVQRTSSTDRKNWAMSPTGTHTTWNDKATYLKHLWTKISPRFSKVSYSFSIKLRFSNCQI